MNRINQLFSTKQKDILSIYSVSYTHLNNKLGALKKAIILAEQM